MGFQMKCSGEIVFEMKKRGHPFSFISVGMSHVVTAQSNDGFVLLQSRFSHN